MELGSRRLNAAHAPPQCMPAADTRALIQVALHSLKTVLKDGIDYLQGVRAARAVTPQILDAFNNTSDIGCGEFYAACAACVYVRDLAAGKEERNIKATSGSIKTRSFGKAIG
ncbi:hypothetical protein LZ554_009451 [Drepanopeziza brunnea f. sp. 'monogermtubi']|nr:hypothetical protein LZ554_009451 [Drepanopeziza brunnea f. sp. 'monogermtubi']